MRPIILGLAVVVLASTLGCGESRPPTGPTLQESLPEVLTVTGTVVDTAHRGLSGVRVEVRDGSRAGTAALTGDDGRFQLPGKLPLAFTLTFSKDGFVPETRFYGAPPSGLPQPTGRDVWLELPSVIPPINLVGTYTLTVTADAACTSLPGEARTRTYTATVRALTKPTDFAVALSDARFFSVYYEFGIQTAGTFVRFDIYRWVDALEPAIVEQIGNTTDLALFGTADMSAGSSGITAATVPFDGTIAYCSRQTPLTGSVYQCDSTDRAACDSRLHTLTVVRR
jgi:hypothetical protein